MRIGVNLIGLRRGQSGGIRQHLLGLLSALLDADSEANLICFVGRSSGLEPDLPQFGVRSVEIWSPGRSIEAQYQHGAFDVLFAAVAKSGMEEPVAPTVTLIPDLQHEDLPDNFTDEVIERRRRRWHWSAMASQKVCVSSMFVRDRAVHHLGLSPEKFVLTPPPLPTAFLAEPSHDTVAAYERTVRCRLPPRFLFYPANTWPHKNHHRLMEALARFHGANAPAVVLSGWAMSAHRDMRRQIKRLGLEHRVHWLGYLADEFVPLVYRDAVGLVFPSLYEGYGIPLLEALQSDCPILCSNTTACPEVVGDAAMTFDPESVDAIAEAVHRLWTNTDLAESLINEGRRRRYQVNHRLGGPNLAKALHDAVARFVPPSRWRWENEPNLSHAPEKKDLPLVSVITPSFQQARFIAETIQSVAAQDYPNIEHIIVDGGSTDGTVDILKSYGNRLRWVSEPDQGQAHAVNKGLAMAQGQIIGWLNSDDTYLPGAVSKAVAALEKPSGAMVVYGEAHYTDVGGKVLGRYPTETASLESLLTHCILCQPTVFFRRRLVDQVGALDVEFKMAMDYELWLRFSKVTTLLYIPDYLATSRMYPENKTSRFHRLSIAESIKACRRHYHGTSAGWRATYAASLRKRAGRLSRIALLGASLYTMGYVRVWLTDAVCYVSHRGSRVARRLAASWSLR